MKTVQLYYLKLVAGPITSCQPPQHIPMLSQISIFLVGEQFGASFDGSWNYVGRMPGYTFSSDSDDIVETDSGLHDYFSYWTLHTCQGERHNRLHTMFLIDSLTSIACPTELQLVAAREGL